MPPTHTRLLKAFVHTHMDSAARKHPSKLAELPIDVVSIEQAGLVHTCSRPLYGQCCTQWMRASPAPNTRLCWPLVFWPNPVLFQHPFNDFTQGVMQLNDASCFQHGKVIMIIITPSPR
jgi:hypothetical protein